MKFRALRRSEVILLILTFFTIFTVVNVIFWGRFRDRIKAAEEKITTLEEQKSVNEAMKVDEDFWQSRSDWLDERMPKMGDFGTLQGKFIEELRNDALQWGIAFESQALNKPEGGSAHHKEVTVSVLAEGPDQAIFQWLASLQSPEKFQSIKSISLFNDTGDKVEPQMDCKLTLSRWYRP